MSPNSVWVFFDSSLARPPGRIQIREIGWQDKHSSPVQLSKRESRDVVASQV